MSILLWLLSIFCLFVTYLRTPDLGILCAIFVFLFSPIISWGMLFSLRKKIQVDITAPTIVEKRSPFVLEIHIHSNGKLPLGKTVMWLEISNVTTREQQKKRICFQESDELKLESAYCGCVECVVARVWCYDWFGILPFPIPWNGKRNIVVMPDTFPVEIDNKFFYNSLADSMEYLSHQKGKDNTEIFQIREYEKGDSVKQIHWKLSSKLEKCMVRDLSELVNQEVLIFLDRDEKFLEPSETDSLMEAVTSVCQGFTEAEQPVRLAWKEEEMISISEIHSNQQLSEAISAMLKSQTA